MSPSPRRISFTDIGYFKLFAYEIGRILRSKGIFVLDRFNSSRFWLSSLITVNVWIPKIGDPEIPVPALYAGRKTMSVIIIERRLTGKRSWGPYDYTSLGYPQAVSYRDKNDKREKDRASRNSILRSHHNHTPARRSVNTLLLDASSFPRSFFWSR